MRRLLALLVAVVVAVATLVVAPAPRLASAADVVDRIDTLGAARDLGSPAVPIGARTVGIAWGKNGGCWIATSDGGVHSFGGAPFYGSAGGTTLAAPIVGITQTPRGDGYWLVGADGGIFSYGAAGFHGSLGSTRLNAPIIGIAATPTGSGYWLAAADGGVFSFGDARYGGGLGGTRLVAPIVGVASSPVAGYWLAAADGGVFAFGGAGFHGSAGGTQLPAPVTAITASHTGRGYALAGADGAVHTFGDAPNHGRAAAGAEQVRGILAFGPYGYWLLRSPQQSSFPPVPANSGVGRRIVYHNGQQRVWVVEADGWVVRSYLVSGKYRTPNAGTYQVFSKSRVTSAGHDGITMEHMVRFARGESLAIGFHGIPRDASGRPLQTDDDLGGYRSAGCVRQSSGDAAFLYSWAPVGTTVVVLW
jgi:hypothetical protein